MMTFVDFGRFQTQSIELQTILEKLPKFAIERRPILVQGEKGTGRRLMAEAIHDKGPSPFRSMIRWRPPFIGPLWSQVQFGDSVLVDQIHLFDQDQIDELWEMIQEVNRRVGHRGAQWIFTSDSTMMRDSSFERHRDFVDWMNFTIIEIPNLKDRNDLPFLAEFILNTTCLIAGKAQKKFSAQALEDLGKQDWQGNVAELEQVIERAVRGTFGHIVDSVDLGLNSAKPIKIDFKLPSMTLEEIERKLIIQTLDLTQNNKTQAAKLLGISIRTLRNKLSLYREAGIYESDVR